MNKIKQLFIFLIIIFLPLTAIGEETTPATLKQALVELRAVYEIEEHLLADPIPDEPQGETLSAAQLLKAHNLITPSLFKHVENIGGLDFDILTSSQDWDLKWKVVVGEPIKNGKDYKIPVTLDRDTEKSIVSWKFVEQNGKWQIDDASYLEPGEKPFTLRSLQEGD